MELYFTEKAPCWICDSVFNKHSYTLFSFLFSNMCFYFSAQLCIAICAVHHFISKSTKVVQKKKNTKIKSFPFIKTVPVVKWLQPAYITAQDPFLQCTVRLLKLSRAVQQKYVPAALLKLDHFSQLACLACISLSERLKIMKLSSSLPVC